MARSTKRSVKKPSTAKKPVSRTLNNESGFRYRLFKPVRLFRQLRDRRPHRSFRLTRRRDYVRGLNIPGYVAFTGEVIGVLWKNRRLFLAMTFVFSAAFILLGGVSSPESYNELADIAEEGEDVMGKFGSAALLAIVAASSGPSSDIQQVYIGLAAVMTWLITVWLLRQINAGNNPKFRDGLYNAGAPLMSTVILVLIFLVQLVPLGLLALAYGALSQTGSIESGLGSFLFFGIASIIIALTLYWITSTFLALSIVTLPGMYPWQAMRAAGDIVLGRRVKVLLRILWVGLLMSITWLIILIPIIMIDQSLRSNVEWFALVPLVPVAVSIMMVASIIWMSAYVYMLYRRIVADDSN